VTNTTPIDLVDPPVERKPRAKRNGNGLAKLEEAPPVPVITTPGDAFLAMIERAARDPQVDIDKMERLFAMHEKMQAQQAKATFGAAMAAAQAELIPVARNKRNNQTSSNYADLAAIADAAMPIVHKHGFGIICSEFRSDKNDHLGVACTVTHAGGHSERHEFHIPWDGAGLKGNANKTPTHAYGSTLSYGRRYATCNIFNISTKDDDGNAASKKTAAPERISEKQVADLNALLQKTDEPAANVQIIFEHFKVGDLADLTPEQYRKTIAQLSKKVQA
jgi:ERF superfamily.